MGFELFQWVGVKFVEQAIYGYVQRYIFPKHHTAYACGMLRSGYTIAYYHFLYFSSWVVMLNFASDFPGGDRSNCCECGLLWSSIRRCPCKFLCSSRH
jgi:hypothetical protein